MIGREVVGGFQRMIASGFEFNAQIEQARLGIASILMAQGEFTTSLGYTLAGYEKLNAAIGMSSELVNQLKVDNLRTIATLDQLVKAFQQGLAPALEAGFNIQQARQFTVAMVQAAGALGLNLNMMAEEMRSILRGTITPRATFIATALGITNEDIRRYRVNSEQLFDFLMTRLDAFRVAGIENQRTWLGLISNIKDLFLNILGEGLTPLFEYIKEQLIELQRGIVVIDEATGEITIDPELLAMVTEIAAVIRGFTVEVKDLVGFLRETQEAWKAIYNVLRLSTASYSELGDRAAEWLGWTGKVKGEMSAINRFFRYINAQIDKMIGRRFGEWETIAEQEEVELPFAYKLKYPEEIDTTFLEKTRELTRKVGVLWSRMWEYLIEDFKEEWAEFERIVTGQFDWSAWATGAQEEMDTATGMIEGKLEELRGVFRRAGEYLVEDFKEEWPEFLGLISGSKEAWAGWVKGVRERWSRGIDSMKGDVKGLAEEQKRYLRYLESWKRHLEEIGAVTQRIQPPTYEPARRERPEELKMMTQLRAELGLLSTEEFVRLGIMEDRLANLGEEFSKYGNLKNLLGDIYRLYQEQSEALIKASLVTDEKQSQELQNLITIKAGVAAYKEFLKIAQAVAQAYAQAAALQRDLPEEARWLSEIARLKQMALDIDQDLPPVLRMALKILADQEDAARKRNIELRDLNIAQQIQQANLEVAQLTKNYSLQETIHKKLFEARLRQLELEGDLTDELRVALGLLEDQQVAARDRNRRLEELDLERQILEVRRQYADMTGQLQEQLTVTQLLLENEIARAKAAQTWSQAWEDAVRLLQSAVEYQQELTRLQTEAELGRELGELAGDWEAYIRGEEGATKAAYELFLQTQNLTEESKRLAAAIHERRMEELAAARELNEVYLAQAGMREFVIQTNIDVVEAVKRMWPEAIQAVENSIHGLIMDVTSGTVEMDDAINSFLRNLSSSLISLGTEIMLLYARMMLLKSLASAFGGAVFGMGGGGEVDISGPAPWAGQLQKGGVFTQPTFGLLGEAGPEAVVPLSGGRSIPVEMRGREESARTSNIYIVDDRSKVPTLTPDDVLVIVSEDLEGDGIVRKSIKRFV
jgi:hypothetical protein